MSTGALPCQRGLTLLELVMATAITAALVLTFTTAEFNLLSQAEVLMLRGQERQEVETVMRELEQAVRMSEEILKAGPDVLEVRGRFFINDDDTEERVLYTVSAGVLEKQIASGGGGYNAPATVIANVSGFRASFIQIAEDFDRDRWGGPFDTGQSLVADTALTSSYDLTTMGQVDPNLVAFLDLNGEYVVLDAGAAALDIVLSPALTVDGLQISMTFTPRSASVDYMPILIGDPAGDYATLQFFSAGVADTLTRESGVPTSAMGLHTWSTTETYRLRVNLFDGRMHAWMDDGGGPEALGVSATGFLDTAAVHVYIPQGGSRATIDDIEITQTRVDLELDVDSSTGTQTRRGSAHWRQR